MAKYVYPAVFTLEEDGLYSICFPDVKSCFTSGDSIIHGMEMAEDVLAMMLCFAEKNNETIPEPTPIKEIKTDENSFVTLIKCDTTNYPLVECEPSYEE